MIDISIKCKYRKKLKYNNKVFGETIDFDMIENTLEQIREKKPLIHCITNPIAIHDSANAVLALGARPIMAEHPDEVEEIASTASALSLNLGNITDARIKSIKIAIEAAFKKNIPVVLDMVGVGCSSIRMKIVRDILDIYSVYEKRQKYPLILKGNMSEVMSLYLNEKGKIYHVSGVDSSDEDIEKDEAEIVDKIVEISKKFNAIIVSTAPSDVIVYRDRVSIVDNGTPKLSMITGTGCMLGAMIGTMISVGNIYEGTVLSTAILGICGELAEEYWSGTGSFCADLMDEISEIDADTISENIKIRVVITQE